MNDEGQKKKPGMVAPNSRKRLIIAAAAVVVVVAAIIYLVLYLQHQAAATIKLPINKTINLGESTASLKKGMGDSIEVVGDGNTALYPKNVVFTEDIQEVFTFKNNKTVGVRYFLPWTDKDTLPGTPLSVTQLRAQQGGKLKSVDLSKTGARFVGYMTSGSGVEHYYFIDPCGDKTRIVTEVVLLASNRNDVLGNSGVGCNVRGN